MLETSNQLTRIVAVDGAPTCTTEQHFVGLKFHHRIKKHELLITAAKTISKLQSTAYNSYF